MPDPNDILQLILKNPNVISSQRKYVDTSGSTHGHFPSRMNLQMVLARIITSQMPESPQFISSIYNVEFQRGQFGVHVLGV